MEDSVDAEDNARNNRIAQEIDENRVAANAEEVV